MKDDIILTLSTCHGEKKKLVVQAKLIKKEIKKVLKKQEDSSLIS